MPYHVRILAGRVDRGAGSHVYHMELARRLAARGHRVSLVCFDALPGVDFCANGYRVPPPAEPPGRSLWRFASLRNCRHCSRGLARLELPPADVVIGGEHFFLKSHARKFPQTPWVYLPHSLVIDQEILSYNLPRFMHWVSSTLYVHLQKWALRHAHRTMRFTRMACTALTKRYGPRLRPRFFINPMATDPPEWKPRAPISDTVHLLWVGQLIPRKRIDLALTALARMSAMNWVFDVVGDGTSRAELEEQTQRLGLGERVRF